MLNFISKSSNFSTLLAWMKWVRYGKYPWPKLVLHNFFQVLYDIRTPKECLQPQSTYIHRAPQFISPRRNWDPPTPLPQARCPTPGPKGGGGGHSRLRLRGWRSPNSDDWIKSLCSTLPTLCLHTTAFHGEHWASSSKRNWVTRWIELWLTCMDMYRLSVALYCATYIISQLVMAFTARNIFNSVTNQRNSQKIQKPPATLI